MIPAEFDYAAPESVEDAVELLADAGDDAKLLAGGHSLIPLMKLRFAAPSLIVDLRRIEGLDGVGRAEAGLRIGALTTHRTLERAPQLGLIARAAGSIADPQVRTRGTIGGSLAHGDPAGDLGAVVLAAGGSVIARGPNGEREIAAEDLFQEYLTTAIGPDEVLTEVRIPSLDDFGWAHQKFTRRHEDWAIVGVCALVKAQDGVCADARVGLTSMGSTPLRASAVEQALTGKPLDAQSIASAAELAAEGTSPSSEFNATPEYRRHLARVLCRRALEEAASRVN